MRIENSVTKVYLRHHKACRVMPNSYPVAELSIHTKQPSRILFLHTLRQQHLSIYFMLFGQQKFSSAFTFNIDIVTFCRNDIKKNLHCEVKKMFWHCTRTPPPPRYKTTISYHGNSGQVCRNYYSVILYYKPQAVYMLCGCTATGFFFSRKLDKSILQCARLISFFLFQQKFLF